MNGRDVGSAPEEDDDGEIDDSEIDDTEIDDGERTVLGTDLELVAIVAVAENGVIGADGEMPWHVPEDLAHFERVTTGHPVIMGRITYEGVLAGLGEPLPDRTTVVLTSRDPETPENVVVAHDLTGALRAAETAAVARHGGADRAFVAGGATVYEQLLPVADRLMITEVQAEPDGDTRFPEWDREAWRELSREENEGFAFVEYVRRE